MVWTGTCLVCFPLALDFALCVFGFGMLSNKNTLHKLPYVIHLGFYLCSWLLCANLLLFCVFFLWCFSFLFCFLVFLFFAVFLFLSWSHISYPFSWLIYPILSFFFFLRFFFVFLFYPFSWLVCVIFFFTDLILWTILVFLSFLCLCPGVVFGFFVGYLQCFCF